MFKPTEYFDLSKSEFSSIFDGVEYVWQILPKITDYIKAARPRLIAAGYRETAPDLWLGEGTVIPPTASVSGPAIIGKKVEIRHGAFIRGSAIIGNGCVIGNSCEIKNSFIFDSVQIPHFNYVGDSVMGYKSHIGAGVILSNVKSVPGNVSVKTKDGFIDTGLRKFSAIIGDHTEAGCNTVFNPGTIVGKECVIYPLTSVRGVIPARTIVKNDGKMMQKR